jgi:hypothetical protein
VLVVVCFWCLLIVEVADDWKVVDFLFPSISSNGNRPAQHRGSGDSAQAGIGGKPLTNQMRIIHE